MEHKLISSLLKKKRNHNDKLKQTLRLLLDEVKDDNLNQDQDCYDNYVNLNQETQFVTSTNTKDLSCDDSNIEDRRPLSHKQTAKAQHDSGKDEDSPKQKQLKRHYYDIDDEYNNNQYRQIQFKKRLYDVDNEDNRFEQVRIKKSHYNDNNDYQRNNALELASTRNLTIEVGFFIYFYN